MPRQRQPSAGLHGTQSGQDVVRSGRSDTHIGKAGHITEFWSLVASGFSDPEEFKASVIKDCEVLSVVGALFLTIAFQLLFIDTDESPVHLHIAFACFRHLRQRVGCLLIALMLGGCENTSNGERGSGRSNPRPPTVGCEASWWQQMVLEHLQFDTACSSILAGLAELKL